MYSISCRRLLILISLNKMLTLLSQPFVKGKSLLLTTLHDILTTKVMDIQLNVCLTLLVMVTTIKYHLYVISIIILYSF